MAFSINVQVPLDDESPKWLSHFEFTREGDEIVIQVVKENGLAYCEARMSDTEFNKMADLILTRSTMEGKI